MPRKLVPRKVAQRETVSQRNWKTVIRIHVPLLIATAGGEGPTCSLVHTLDSQISGRAEPPGCVRVRFRRGKSVAF